MLNIAKSGLQILTVNGSDYKSEPAGELYKTILIDSLKYCQQTSQCGFANRTYYY